MKLITLLAFAGLFATALAAGAVSGLPGADMAAMGVLATEPLPDRAVVEQNAAGPGEGSVLGGGWGSEVQITNNRLENVTYYNNGHKVVYGAGGVGHMVWYDNKGDAVYYKRYYRGSGWSKDLQLAKSGDHPSIALDSNGTTIHVVWCARKQVGSTNWHIFYQKCNPTPSGTGGWVGSPTDLCENASGHNHNSPSIACGPKDQVVVSWGEFYYPYLVWSVWSVGFREFVSGKWQTQIELDVASTFYRYDPSIAVGRAGDVFVAYYGTQANEASQHVYVKRRLNNVWQPWEDATPAGPGIPDTFCLPDIDVNPTTGFPHIVCYSHQIVEGVGYGHIYHTYSSTLGVWIVPEMISDPAVRVDAMPSMFFDGDGTAHVVWHGSDADQTGWGIKYASRPGDGGTWTTPYWLTSNVSGVRDNAPNITVGADGSLHVVWTRNNSTSRYPYQIWGRTGTTSFGFGGQAAGTTVAPRGFALDVSPNPASRRMVVSYSLPVAANVSLKLYDVSGALAKTVACGNVLPGSHAVSLSRQGLARGAYILKLESGASSLTRKLIVE